jgi:hypothetical protein
VDCRSRRNDDAGQRCKSLSWRIALLERFWQASTPASIRRRSHCVIAQFPPELQLRRLRFLANDRELSLGDNATKFSGSPVRSARRKPVALSPTHPGFFSGRIFLRTGADQGSNPHQAFFGKCSSDAAARCALLMALREFRNLPSAYDQKKWGSRCQEPQYQRQECPCRGVSGSGSRRRRGWQARRF